MQSRRIGEALYTWMDTRGRNSSRRIKGSPGTKIKVAGAVEASRGSVERVWIGALTPGVGVQGEVEDPRASGALSLERLLSGPLLGLAVRVRRSVGAALVSSRDTEDPVRL